MATPIGDRDVLLLGSGQRALNPLGADIILSLSAPLFKVDSQGNGLPSTIKVTASLISISGTVSWSASGATVTNNNDNTANVTFASVSGTSCTITASITVNGQAFTKSITINKVSDATGTPGPSGTQYATVYMYQWNASTPAKPTGTSGYTWATGVNSTYSGSDGWTVNVPTNPGTANLRLYVATVQISAAGGTASTVVSYTNASVQAWAQNGAAGASGVQAATFMVYQWAASIPAGPAGAATYTWSGGGISSIPSGWTSAPGIAPSQGITLWAARVYLTDAATNTTTNFNWTSAAVIAVGFSGSNGAAGPQGASYVTAYCASSTGTATSAPAQTTGKTSLPAANSGGITGTWSTTVPTLSVGQYLYQTDGIYDPTTDKITWSVPYWSSLKVGSLSAITANLGSINAGSIDLGSGSNSWHVDPSGNMWIGASTLATAPFYVDNAGNVFMNSVLIKDKLGNTVLSSGSSLASQTAANPNLIPRLTSWPTGSRYNSANVYTNFNGHPAINGELIGIPGSNGSYAGVESAAVGIQPNVYYTVSFDAHCYNGNRDINVDLYGTNVDTAGIYVPLTGTPTRYSFTEVITAAEAPLARLRVFGGGAGGASSSGTAEIYNIKVETGTKQTHWTDNIITPANASTFIQNLAVSNAQIANLAVSLAKIDTATINNLSALSATIGTFRTATTGARTEISDNVIKMFADNNQKILHIGDSTK